MHRSIATVSLSGMLRQKLEAIATARFDGVEIFENDLLQFSGTPSDVRRIAEDLGLSIDLFQPFRDFEGVSPAQLLRNIDRAERKFDLMHELGAPMVLVCSNAQPDASGDMDLIAEQMHMLAERAGKRGLRVGFEALAWGTHIDRFSQAWSIVERVAHPHFGLILDSFHTLALRDDYLPIAKIPGEKIFFVQLADAPWVNTDVLSHSRHYRCFPGQGQFDVDKFTRVVLQSGYAGPLSLEIFNDDLRAAPARASATDAMRSLLWLEDRVLHLPPIGEAAPATPTVHRVPLIDLPPAPELQGWSFIEFAADRATADRLRAFLSVIGFRKIGRHRSKQVELFGLGDVRVVLNLEEDSFARSYFEMHGTSACAVALSTSDAVAALARAEALGCTRVAGRIGPNELTIPAVRAPDGSLVYFFDVHKGGTHGFEADFILDIAPDEGVAQGARIDHISQVVPLGGLDTWVLFYRSVLGLEAVSSAVMNDPFGVIRSRAMESADKAVRYSLNVSDRHNTAAGRSVSVFGGAGVHHIAIAVSDVLRCAKTLLEAGTPMLEVPDNYYDDLAARYDLAPELLDQMRSYNVLYDRNAQGEFLHVYTVPFDNRFFFEFIERRGAYDQYGAVNAPVRLAALAQWRAENEVM